MNQVSDILDHMKGDEKTGDNKESCQLLKNKYRNLFCLRSRMVN